MRIRAVLHMMAESEILAMVPADRLREIKAKDPRPQLKAFVVGHEGEARGNLVGVGNIVKRWFSDMVRKLNDKIRIGLKLFHGHATTNTDGGRVPIGEVVGKKLMDVKNKLSSVVACWIYPDFRGLPLDVASIEADVDLSGASMENLKVSGVNDITGIALGNSRVETPGFPGATLLGQLQAFIEKQQLRITLFGGENEMTLEEARKAIREAKLKPSDIFGQDDLMADPLIGEQVKEKIKNARGYDYRKFEELTEEKTDLQKKLDAAEAKVKEHEETIGKLQLETAKSKVDDLFETQKKERKLDEKQEKYLKNRLSRFAPKDADKADAEFNEWLDGQLDDYKKDAEALGIEIGEGGGDGGSEGGDGDKDKKGAGAEPDTKKTTPPESKYLDPKQNPMIKTG